MSKGPPAHIRRADIRKLYDDRHPGMSRDDLDKMIDESFGRDPSAVSEWSALQLGKVMEMTFEQQQRLNIRTIAPYDRTVEEMKAFSREQKRARQRNWVKERRRRRTERKPEMKRIDDRAGIIRNLLNQQAEQPAVGAGRRTRATARNGETWPRDRPQRTEHALFRSDSTTWSHR